MKFILLFLAALLVSMGGCRHALAEEDNSQDIFTGSATAAGKDAMLTFQFTKHVGGQWDAAQINRGSAFLMEYEGPEDGVQLVLISHSGSNRWAPMPPDETGKKGKGWYALFRYDTFAKRYGENFARLDEIRALCTGEGRVRLTRLAYVPGEGEPVDQTDGTWDKPDTGIAFLGDSIVQNVFYNHGDWNTLLGRKDCVNYGIGSQTTVHCLNRIDEIAKKHYSQLVLLCGINDIGSGYTKEEIVGRVEAMFDAVREKNPGIRFVIISVLPTTSAFFRGAQDRMIALDADLKAYADAHGDVDFADCYNDFVGADGYCRDGLTMDGLHPNADGYAIVAEKLRPYLVPET